MEVRLINTVITSKEAILSVCRQMVAENGVQSLNMRTVAEKCHVSVGSVYNYFPSKADLITATIQDVWQTIFRMDAACQKTQSFPDYVTWIFESVKSSVAEYPQFFTAHSLSLTGGGKNKARQVMEGYFGHLKSGLLMALQHDPLILSTAFSEDFSQKAFIDFVFSSLLSLLMRQEASCAVLIEIIRRTLYQPV